MATPKNSPAAEELLAKRDYSFDMSQPCPVCGKQASVRYWNADTKQYTYKHITFGKKTRWGKSKQTTYHFSQA